MLGLAVSHGYVFSAGVIDARVLSIEPVYMDTKLKCVRSDSHKSTASSQEKASRKGTVAVRGFGGFDYVGAQLCIETGGSKLAGYGVTYELGGKKRFATFLEEPQDTLKVDAESEQIIGGVGSERGLTSVAPPKIGQCSKAYELGQDERARKICGWLAEHGNAIAQNKLANLWFDGRGGRKNINEALRWDILGAEQGHGRSMNNLGWMYENGQGVELDYTKAANWYAKSANKGDVCGLNSLGHIYAEGLGVAKNSTIASEYFKKAAYIKKSDAMHCVANAQMNLGWLIENGLGVAKSIPRAAEFYQSAILLGNEQASDRLQDLQQKHRLPNSSKRPQRHIEYFDAQPSIIYSLPSQVEIENQVKPVEVKDINLDTDPGMGPSLSAQLPVASGQVNGIAIVIGNSVYDHSDIAPVSFASNDKALIEIYAKKTLGYDDVRPYENMTKGEMETLFGNAEAPGQLNKWVQDAYQLHGKKPNVFIYYSGHGAPSLDTQKSYLVPRDAKPTQIELGGYSLDLLKSNLGKLDAESVTLIMEACFSGASAGGSLVPNSSALVIKPRAAKSPKNMLYISASGLDQVASWDKKAKLGLMTRYFIQGVSGNADFDSNGMVTVSEVKKYLLPKVARSAQVEYDRTQNPSIVGPDEMILSSQ